MNSYILCSHFFRPHHLLVSKGMTDDPPSEYRRGDGTTRPSGQTQGDITLNHNKINTRSILEYVSTIRSSIVFYYIHNKHYKTTNNIKHNTSIQHLHDEIMILIIHTHIWNLMYHKSDQKIPTSHTRTPLILQSIKHPEQTKIALNNYRYTPNITTHKKVTHRTKHQSHPHDDSHYLVIKRLIQATSSSVDISEASLTKTQRRSLAQLRTNNSPFLLSYLHKVDASRDPSNMSPL